MTIEETHVHPTETALEQLVANHLSGQRSPALLKALLCDACLPHVIQALTELLPYAPFCRPNRSAERDTTLDHRYEEGERTLQTLIRKQQEPDTLNPEDKTTILSYLLDALHDGPDAAAVWIDLAGKYGVSQALPLAKIMLFTFIQPTYFTTFIRLLGATAESLPRLISQSRSRNPEEERALGQRLLQLSLQDPRLVTTCLCSAIRISPDWLRIASFVIDTWPENNAERVALCAAIGDRLVDLRKDLSRSETGISGLYASLQHREDSLTRVAQMSALSTDHGTVLILLALATPKDRIDTARL